MQYPLLQEKITRYLDVETARTTTLKIIAFPVLQNVQQDVRSTHLDVLTTQLNLSLPSLSRRKKDQQKPGSVFSPLSTEANSQIN